jgi:uncharacterized protein YaeQ
VPEAWDRADDETIEQWCCVAKPVTRRASGRHGEAGSAGNDSNGLGGRRG